MTMPTDADRNAVRFVLGKRLCISTDCVARIEPREDGTAFCGCVELLARLIAAERERCASIADGWITNFAEYAPFNIPAQKWASDAVKDIADAIRGNPTNKNPADPSAGG